MAGITCAAAAAVLGSARLPIAKSASVASQIFSFSHRQFSSLCLPVYFQLHDTHGSFSHQVKASSTEETSSSIQTDELLVDLKDKWDAVENKSEVLIYGGGAIVAVWLSSIVIVAINSVPLLPKILELVGLGYTGWFVYYYLLFKTGRKELAKDVEALKKKIAGTGE